MLRLPPCRIVITKEDMEQSRQWTHQHSNPLSNTTQPQIHHLILRPGPQRSRDASITVSDTALPSPMSAEIDCEPDPDAAAACHSPPVSSNEVIFSQDTDVDNTPMPLDGISSIDIPAEEGSLPDINMSEHSLLSRALSASDGDPFSIASESTRTLTPDFSPWSSSLTAPPHVVERVEVGTLPHLSPLDELAARFHNLATQTPNSRDPRSSNSKSPASGQKRLLSGNSFYEDAASDSEGSSHRFVKQYTRKRGSPFDAYVTPEVVRQQPRLRQAYTTPRRHVRMDGADDSVLAQTPSASMLMGSDRYPAATCAPLPDFDALAARDTYPSCVLTPARRAQRFRRSPRKRQPPVPVYDDSLPADMQARTPADLQYVSPGARMLMRSATVISPDISTPEQMVGSHINNPRRSVADGGPPRGPLRQSSSAHVLPYPPSDPGRRFSRRPDGTPSSFVRHTYSQHPSGPRLRMTAPRRCRHASGDQENEFDPVALGMESELLNWRANQTSEVTRRQGMDDTPPRRGRYDQYLE